MRSPGRADLELKQVGARARRTSVLALRRGFRRACIEEHHAHRTRQGVPTRGDRRHRGTRVRAHGRTQELDLRGRDALAAIDLPQSPLARLALADSGLPERDDEAAARGRDLPLLVVESRAMTKIATKPRPMPRRVEFENRSSLESREAPTPSPMMMQAGINRPYSRLKR